MIKNIEKAAKRIKESAKNKEKIIVYSDSDLDGIASAVLMEETIHRAGGEVSMVVFPDREKDGYGINVRALEFLKERAPCLFITLDLGIANVKEVDLANEMGFEVVIIDHHQPLQTLPRASIIVNPRQEGDTSGLDYLSNAGLVFKVAEVILEDELAGDLKNNFLELVALATISDMVPQVGDNKGYIEEGLTSLKSTSRLGLKTFVDVIGKKEMAGSGYTKIISCLNAAESNEFKNKSYELLGSTSLNEAQDIREELMAKAQLKQQRIREITEEVERRISEKQDETVIFEGDPAWKLTLAGPVASNIAVKYGKPTFIYKRGDTVTVGSVRSLKEGCNSVTAMESCKDCLIAYGGHPKASGFRIKTENLEKFKASLEEYFRNLQI